MYKCTTIVTSLQSASANCKLAEGGREVMLGSAARTIGRLSSSSIRLRRPTFSQDCCRPLSSTIAKNKPLTLSDYSLIPFTTTNTIVTSSFSSTSFQSTPIARHHDHDNFDNQGISDDIPPYSDNAAGKEEDEVEDSALPPRYTTTTDAYSAIELALDSVVKIFTVSSSPSYFLPWQNKSQRETMGSGFVIPGKRILTNAHVVADHTFVLVRKHGSPTKYRAEVQAVGHECDLAILVVESKEFWEGMTFLELGDIPFLQEAVAVVGYPQGGDNISVTKGVVSRVEPTQYVHGATQLMAIQIDAAINPGNSGGPAIMGNKVAGVAFQNLSGAENIGYIIPVPVIKHFIAGVEESGKYVGFCSLGLTCQPTENVQLRSHFQMCPGMTGVLVSKINPLSDAHRILKKDDIILAFDGVPIANDGSVPFRNRERITFDHLVSMKKPNEMAEVRVLRDGEEYEFSVTLRPLQPLVPVHQFDKLPSYFIFAGLVFIPLTQPYLHEYGEDWYNTSPRRLCERALKELPRKAGEQLVILSQVLMDDINAGYERLAELQVKKVNGVDIENLKHLCQLVENCSEGRLRFDLDEERVVVLDYHVAKIATSRILKRHRIPSAMSSDLIDGCNGPPMRIPGPPRNGRKDRDEDLLLFREMHKREKERIASLLQPVSEEFEPNGGNYPLYRMASAKKGSGYEFLAESDKNDYDWLKTPPATPLFPSLEMETINAPELAVQRELPIMQPHSRFYVSNSEASKASNGTPKSPNPNPKPKARLRSVTPSNERPSISLAEAKNSKGAQNLNQKTTTQLSSDLISRRSNMGNSTTPKATNQKESNLNFLTSNLSKNMGTDSKSKPRSRGVSPLVRSTIPAQIPGFSDETPPNLRTDERSLSASRGRPSNPTVTNTRQKPESTAKPIRRQSCSPSVTRGRKVEANCKQEITSQGNQRGRIQTGNGTQVFGSRMVERVMNARKSGAEEREAKPKSRGGSINEGSGSGSGFGRMMSKSSLDVALKHMEITKRDHVNFRHPAGNTLGKSSKPTTTTTTTSIS